MSHFKRQKGRLGSFPGHGHVTLVDMQARTNFMVAKLKERPDLKGLLVLFERTPNHVITRKALVAACKGNAGLLNALTTTGFVTGQPGGKFFELTPIASFLFQQHGWGILK